MRLASTALCATCVVLLATFEPMRIVLPSGSPAPCRVERVQPLTVIDAAVDAVAIDLDGLLQLRLGERVTTVNDKPLPPHTALLELFNLPLIRGNYIDLTVSSEMTERRVLVLLH